ncbi:MULTISPECIES: pyridoxal phosphate-dependent aminotransferase [unclassified Oceanispirochaeta]|uniref:pyridoxal phosphate-dependent aminotransferase n=1 Tax=unclassified Oceanispirochaeta TaxID=2635722 RepID=UPI000E09005D|nr:MULTISPECIES: pyridoxal phosphate-dependent aminotransferase [unclassified Oceanispirochaeta]MBF9014760.1 pyridoxal phosphate-dependent aminotransferase [Oceanispirochaeta sp. M2]NPD71016.1 pyridoxal phosphate-dependent aminotransferase [Oceanispirochaeta sp. M1]RDG33849.1 pyridoxal phosphate-dependent aminotransferase [Oceanispirochaeta sp. M1]
MSVKKSHKLDDVCYDIRGPVLKEAVRLEEEGYKILKLNTGNPAAFGFDAPDEIRHDIILNLLKAQGYSDSKGVFSARKAVMHECQRLGIEGVDTELIYLGNGVSELIAIAMQGLLNNGDEILIPMPDYPLWTASSVLAGGKAVHYRCDEESDWYPDLDDIRSKVSKKTKGIVVINPNNPTGAVYPREILEGIVEIARENKLVIYSDEIYDKILYDDASHIPMATLADDVLMVTFNGLSKSYRAAGFRAGWMILSGDTKGASDYIEGLNILSNMRLCSNVPAQLGIQTALGGYQSINDLVAPGGRLRSQRDVFYEKLISIPGVSCVKPRGALYMFPKVDIKKFNIKDDEKLIYDILTETRTLLVQGTGFNWDRPDHFRMVFLPDLEVLSLVGNRLETFFAGYKQS